MEQLLLIKKPTFKNNFVFWKTFPSSILLFSKLWCNLEYNCLFWPENFYELFSPSCIYPICWLLVAIKPTIKNHIKIHHFFFLLVFWNSHTVGSDAGWIFLWTSICNWNWIPYIRMNLSETEIWAWMPMTSKTTVLCFLSFSLCLCCSVIMLLPSPMASSTVICHCSLHAIFKLPAHVFLKVNWVCTSIVKHATIFFSFEFISISPVCIKLQLLV